MNKKIKRVLSLILICTMAFGFAFVAKEKQSNNAKAWAGIGYMAAKKGASAEAGLAIGIIGVWESTLQGAVWGAAFGSAAGACAGAIVGL